jgi:hypothetical protein
LGPNAPSNQRPVPMLAGALQLAPPSAERITSIASREDTIVS